MHQEIENNRCILNIYQLNTEIVEILNLTRERIRQIREKAIKRLKHTSRSKRLKTFLG